MLRSHLYFALWWPGVFWCIEHRWSSWRKLYSCTWYFCFVHSLLSHTWTEWSPFSFWLIVSVTIIVSIHGPYRSGSTSDGPDDNNFERLYHHLSCLLLLFWLFLARSDRRVLFLMLNTGLLSSLFFKPGKGLKTPSNYHTVAMMSFSVRSFERMVWFCVFLLFLIRILRYVTFMSGNGWNVNKLEGDKLIIFSSPLLK